MPGLSQALILPAVIIITPLLLILISKDPNILAKFPWSKASVEYAKKHNIKQTKLQKIMTITLFAIIVIFLMAMTYLYFSKPKTALIGVEKTVLQSPNQEKTSGIGDQEAIEKIRKMPQVQDFLAQVPNAHVEVSSFDKEANTYLVQVFEVKNGHTATHSWWEVEKQTGKVKSLK